MFETQDMLPRAPPMPCAPLLPANTAIIKPAVPEVSIIMGPATKTITTNKQEIPTSYAAWKKQVLPRVKYAPNPQENNAKEQNSQDSGFITTRSNVYPMRTKTIPVSQQPDKVYRHSLESTVQPQTILVPRLQQNIENRRSIDSLPQTILTQRSQNNDQRRSIDSLPQKSQSTDDVLTICASTQTDFATVIPLTNELSQLMGIIKDLQDEQRQMRQLFETFLVQQQQQQTEPIIKKIYCCEVATQCDILVENSEDNDTLHQALPNVKIYSANLKDSPRLVQSMAQSASYRPNTPSNMKQIVGFSTPPTNQYQNIQLPKPNTEKSMVMNELAFKYLPSEKINELLQDMAINSGSTAAATTTTPLREIDNFNKAPVDMSNASYKYLRKYRLLPDQNGTPPPPPVQNAIHSPYQQRPQDSPLTCINGNNSETENGSPHIDLDHIRRQPKFL